MHRAKAVLSFLLFFTASAMAAEERDFFYVEAAGPLLEAGAAIIDARPLAACQQRTLKNARCLPAADFLGPHRRLAAVPDILWAFGTAGLTGAETVLVVGDEPTARDFVAGLLYLGGQRRVAVLRPPVGQGANLPPGALGSGSVRAMTREAVFQVPVRDELWLLRGDLAAHRTATSGSVLIDGRSENEFWGETVRAARGGHLPGAESLPAATARAALTRGEAIVPPSGMPVVYAHDAVEGIAYFTLLRAGAGLSVRVYPGGWAEWAADGTLPADGATYPDRVAIPMPAASTAALGPTWPVLLAGALMGAALAAGGFFLGRRRPG
jgi:thiosulfate/3-mercaptopyruvate sulfurtransferase